MSFWSSSLFSFGVGIMVLSPVVSRHLYGNDVDTMEMITMVSWGLPLIAGGLYQKLNDIQKEILK